MRLIDTDKLLEKTECLFKDLNSTEDYMGIGYNHGVGDSIAIIKNAPTIEAEPVKHGRWVPVNERLPEEDTEVLISYRYKEGEGDTSHVDIDITTYGQMYFGGNKVGNSKHWRAPFEYFHSNYEVIAWMPLPEPYKREDNDEEGEA